MKKILTLMAAMSAVAGPAMADDYVWNVDATGNITAEVKGDIAFANNKFTFTVNSGEPQIRNYAPNMIQKRK